MTAPRAREANDPPSPPDRRPPRRGGGSSPSTYAASAAGGPRGLLRPARRAGLAAAGLAGVVLAAGLALAPPAQAQETIWSATLTVGKNSADSIRGYSRSGGASYGELSDNTFSYDNADYTIRTLDYLIGGTHWLRLRSNIAFTDNTISELILVVGGTSFPLSDASPGFGSDSDRIREWNNSGIGWAEGDTIAVSLPDLQGRGGRGRLREARRQRRPPRGAPGPRSSRSRRTTAGRQGPRCRRRRRSR